jgi:acyl transferase domain-containing protein
MAALGSGKRCVWEENLVYSRDGHVRPFDQSAAGTVFGDSIGAVVLKVLDDAVEDGDNIVALLSGSSVTITMEA